ncbi:MAG: prepilin-type N-terminal cleavage/methylation domain-containing protein [Acidobacteriota bacterium]
MNRERGTDMNQLRDKRQAGFSLIEVLVSLGLLAWVIVGVSSLFIFGGRQVYSGKKMTEAYSLAQDTMEEIDRMTYMQAYTYFLPTGTNPATATNYTVDTSVAGLLNTSTGAEAARAAYQAAIDGRFTDGKALIRVQGLDNSGTLVALASAVALRVTVTLEWYEGSHQRFLHLRSVRF